MRPAVLLLLAVLFCRVPSFSQEGLVARALDATGLRKPVEDGAIHVSQKSLRFIESKYDKLNGAVEKQSRKMLSRLQKKEEKLRRKLARKDSSAAGDLFSGSEEQYQSLRAKLLQPVDSSQSFPLTEYVPGIDSMQSALSFLVQRGGDGVNDIQKASGELKQLQGNLQKANEIEAFVRQRERALKERLQSAGLGKELKSINKEAFYYSQRLREYKELLNNKEKLEQKILGAVRESKLFQSFMQKNSYLAKLFPVPANYGTPQALAGLQTRAGVQGMMQQRFGSTLSSSSGRTLAAPDNSSGSGNYLQQQMAAAQAQLGELKDKMSRLGLSGGSSDMTMPDFKPNSQHTRSFFRRLEWGMNVQSEKSHSIVPTTSDIALTVGYKLSDRAVAGAGASYRMGWGNEGIKHIRITHEGVGLRSYLDLKAKGSIWVTGGYEMNYMQAFTKYEQLKDISAWQRSGLIGLTKKYKVGKKENNIQLLWDFLSYGQVPKTPALKFRVGYTF